MFLHTTSRADKRTSFRVRRSYSRPCCTVWRFCATFQPRRGSRFQLFSLEYSVSYEYAIETGETGEVKDYSSSLAFQLIFVPIISPYDYYRVLRFTRTYT